MLTIAVMSLLGLRPAVADRRIEDRYDRKYRADQKDGLKIHKPQSQPATHAVSCSICPFAGNGRYPSQHGIHVSMKQFCAAGCEF